MTNIDVTFICCVWNEIERAPDELSKVIECLSESELSYEILLIDNCSTDGTRDWVANVSYPSVTGVLNDTNLGKGGSIKKGIGLAHGAVSIIFDLDGEYLIEDAITGYAHVRDSGATVALASRTLGGRAKYIYFQNYIGVMFLTYLINILYSVKLTDSATGLKLLDTNYFKTCKLRYSGFNVDFELVCAALNKGKIVSEYPGAYFPRSKTEGKKIKAVKDGVSSVFAILTTFLFK